MAQPRKAVSRYNMLGAVHVPDELGRPPASVHVRTRVGAVIDPYDPDGKSRIAVRINRCVDVLEDERAHKRISEAAYREGRALMRLFEPATAMGSTNWAGTSRVDAWVAKELSVIRGIDRARAITALKGWLRHELGAIDANLVVRIVGEGKSYAEAAALQGKAGDRGMRYIAARFRDALEALAEAKAAVGAERKRRT